jgi:hypothetical protein
VTGTLQRNFDTTGAPQAIKPPTRALRTVVGPAVVQEKGNGWLLLLLSRFLGCQGPGAFLAFGRSEERVITDL